MEQKLLAIEAGLGVGHLPRHRVAAGLASGVLLQVGEQGSTPQEYLAWRLTNRGKGLADGKADLHDQFCFDYPILYRLCSLHFILYLFYFYTS